MACKPTFGRVVVAGDFGASKDSLVEIWRNGAACRGHALTDVRWRADELKSDDLLLIGTANASATAVERLLDTGARAVAYVAANERIDEAIRWCRKYRNLIDLTGGTPGHVEKFRNRLPDIYNARDFYSAITVLHRLGGCGPFGIFTSTPFAPALGGPFLNAVKAVFQEPHFAILNPGDRHGERIWGEVEGDIIKADIVMVNARRTREGKANFNVWIEFGFATGWGCGHHDNGIPRVKKDVLIFRHDGEEQYDWPSDLGDQIWGDYEDEVDLSCRLFFGQPERFRYPQSVVSV